MMEAYRNEEVHCLAIQPVLESAFQKLQKDPRWAFTYLLVISEQLCLQKNTEDYGKLNESEK